MNEFIIRKNQWLLLTPDCQIRRFEGLQESKMGVVYFRKSFFGDTDGK